MAREYKDNDLADDEIGEIGPPVRALIGDRYSITIEVELSDEQLEALDPIVEAEGADYDELIQEAIDMYIAMMSVRRPRRRVTKSRAAQSTPSTNGLPVAPARRRSKETRHD
jgi:hypothetical protein